MFKSHVIIGSMYIKILGLMGDILAVREKISKGIKSMSNKIPLYFNLKIVICCFVVSVY